MTATSETGRFEGKVAFVTGAAGGIGRATALAFAHTGASVTVADVSEQGNEETAHMVEEIGGQALAVRCDVTRSEAIQTALKADHRDVRAPRHRLQQRRCRAARHGYRRPHRRGVGPESSRSTCGACSCA